MMKRIGTLGFAALVAMALLVACGDKTEPDPAAHSAAGPVPENECGWPAHCPPVTAHVMLTDVLQRAQAELPKQGITHADLQIIQTEIARCLLPGLTSTKTSTHVCKVTNPDACGELQGIHARTASGGIPVPLKARQGHWHTIATDLQSFPSGK